MVPSQSVVRADCECGAHGMLVPSPRVPGCCGDSGMSVGTQRGAIKQICKPWGGKKVPGGRAPDSCHLQAGLVDLVWPNSLALSPCSYKHPGDLNKEFKKKIINQVIPFCQKEKPSKKCQLEIIQVICSENFEAQVLLRARMDSQSCSPEPGTKSQDPGSKARSLETLTATARAGAQRGCRPPAAEPGQGSYQRTWSWSSTSPGSPDTGVLLSSGPVSWLCAGRLAVFRG